jgi:hypothetical protein
MKKIMMVLSIFALVMILIGADFRRENSPVVAPVTPKKKCVGYTIIEFGKGIDCNGDTVKLAKVNGGQILARALQQESALTQ